ncbi:hypothetical protein RN333_22285 (plasmid) [Enterobacter kobei]|uniref:hypothetical protein n=1 Tax=Enterobacter kobei TaxID=208224 RepID=UPI0028D0B90B|nr:hypothetical protein [Enterobacter kobei]WNP36975.1 hypothetical protein RN333_22285 [Enterobacter kobei]
MGIDRRNALTRNDELAQSLGLTGTPGLKAMPVKNTTPEFSCASSVVRGLARSPACGEHSLAIVKY